MKVLLLKQERCGTTIHLGHVSLALAIDWKAPKDMKKIANDAA